MRAPATSVFKTAIAFRALHSLKFFAPFQDGKCFGIPFQVAGDAKKVAMAFDAVHQGYGAALDL